MNPTPINISESGGVRYLHFGSEWVQGAMRIRRPNDLELSYTRDMMAGLLLRDGFHGEAGWPQNVLLIGLGAASLTKFCYHKLPQCRVTVVEIDAGVWAAARQFFKLPADDERLWIEIADGVEYITRAGDYYDYILVDGFDEDAKVGLLDSEPFYQACWTRLTDNGLLAANMFGRSRKYAAPLARLSSAFDKRTLALPACESGNVVAFGTRGEAVDISLDELAKRALRLRAQTGLDLRPTVARLGESGDYPTGVLRF